MFFCDVSMYAHLAPAFINDDCTDMSDTELQEFEQLKEDLKAYLKCSSFYVCDVDSETWFSIPEIGGKHYGDIASYTICYQPLSL